jgi:hypothetical protein
MTQSVKLECASVMRETDDDSIKSIFFQCKNSTSGEKALFHLKKIYCAFPLEKYSESLYKVKWRLQAPHVATIQGIENILLDEIQKIIETDQLKFSAEKWNPPASIDIKSRLFEYAPGKYSIDTVVPQDKMSGGAALFGKSDDRHKANATAFDIKQYEAYSCIIYFHSIFLDYKTGDITYSLALSSLL